MHDLVCWGVLAAAAACGTANWTMHWGVNLIRVVSTTMRADNKRPQLLLVL
jgi:hypothetical protein